MAFEIELKARIDDPESVKKRLDSLGEYRGSYEKDDAYWVFTAGGAKTGQDDPSPALPSTGLRVRKETGAGSDGRAFALTRITWKTRDLRDGVEINDEREFEVSDAGIFEDLLGRLGLAPEIVKNKRGWAWDCDGPAGGASSVPGGDGSAGGIRAELSEVRSLGWFLELEILTARNDEKTVTENQKRLFSLLETLNIPRKSIEFRPYTEMLRALPKSE
jgi:adenylate cyclase class 2